MKKTFDQQWFEKLGHSLDKFGTPASKIIEKMYARWLDPLHEKSNDWLVDSDWARLQQEPVRARALLRGMVLIIFVLIIWAALAPLDEIARGEGKVVPSLQLQVIQSFDGGVVQEVFVREGQTVNKGDLLLRIDPTRFLATFRENRAEYFSLQARAARLESLTSDTPLQIPDNLSVDAPDIVQHEKELYESNKRELEEQIAIARSQIDQRTQELNEVNAKVTQATKTLQLAEQELRVTKPLLASGAVSEVEVLRLEGDVANARGDKEQVLAQQLRLQLAIEESQGKLRETELLAKNKWRTELSDVMSKLSALTETGTGLADKIKYADIRAPVRGTVQRVLTNTVGAVVQPGREVIEMVPLDDALIVEAKVPPKDIAFLHPGQEAIVKFTAYDFVVYGGLRGKVEHISADTVTDEKERTFYIVRVRTEREGFNPSLPILPGMTAQVDILTGKKTVLAYLLKPVLRAKQNALSER
jgi:membrane fusion protein, adhesin transport system